MSRATTALAKPPAESSRVAVDRSTAGAVRRFGVAGFPVAHSRSPAIHMAAYAALGVEADYQRLPIPPPLFAETVRALPGSGFAGINVTIPHKQAALELADTASDAARMIGAANTLSFGAGRITADNTDAPGMLAAIDTDLRGAELLVLGAGGTARAALFAAAGAGARVSVWNRTPERALMLAGEFGATAVPEVAGAADGAQFIVNTTSLGMATGDTPESVLEALGLQLEALRNDTVIVDFVYRDGGSPLTVAARERGLAVVDGLELLVRQAALSFELWFGRSAPIAAMRAAAVA